MEAQNENDIVRFKISRVKEVSFNVNEKLFTPPTPENHIQCRINCNFNYNLQYNSIIIELNAFFYYLNSSNEEQLTSTIVQNVFEVIDLKKYHQENELKLPAHFIVSIMSMSIAHTRALFSKNTDGTVYGGVIMPIINPTEFSKSIFPKIFENI